MDEYEMKDCISRKEATEFINKCLEHEEKLQLVERETLIAVKKYLESIPAADVRPVVHGEWGKRLNPSFSPFDDSGAYLYRCNQCRHNQNYESNFCPNCGADMREES